MVNVNALENFFEGDVTSIQHVATEGHCHTFKALDTTRDNAPTIIIVELQDECYSVEMMISGVMRDMGMFEA